MTQKQLLIVEDDVSFGTLLEEKFNSLGWQVTRALSIDDALIAVTKPMRFSHCILDLNLSNQSGLKLIPDILSQSPECKIVILTGYASVQTTIEAIKLGAIYLLSKPSGIKDILNAFNHLASPEQVRLDPHAKRSIDHAEWETIQKTLIENQFNISKTADQLGMHRRTLQRKLKKNI